ncbi:MAG: hypothetical protein Q9164_004634 [Protoblastenia rupestris]
MEEEQEELRMKIQHRHTSTPALVGKQLKQEILDGMTLRTVTGEEKEKEMADPFSDTEMDIYSAKSQSARIARSNEKTFPASEQVKALKAERPDKLDQIVDAVAHLKAQGQSLETIHSQLPNFTANQVRRAMSPKTISGVTGSK